MAIYGVSFVLPFVVWDTTANAGRTTDAPNLTLRWVKDGASAAPANAPTEVDAVTAPGLYKVTLTAAEAQATFGALAGVSSTAGVTVMPVQVAFEKFPANFDLLAISGAGLLSDTPGITTLLGRLSAVRAALMDNLVNLDAAISSISAGAIADAVWDEALSGHAVVGSAGAAVSDASGAVTSTELAYAVAPPTRRRVVAPTREYR